MELRGLGVDDVLVDRVELTQLVELARPTLSGGPVPSLSDLTG